MSRLAFPYLLREDAWSVRAAIRLIAGPLDPAMTVPTLNLHKMAIIAKDALEVLETPDLEAVMSGSDWLLYSASLVHRLKAPQKAAALYERIAASTLRSPLLTYEDVFARAAESLARRGQWAEALERQRQGIAEVLREEDGAGVGYNLGLLAHLHGERGDVSRALEIYAGIFSSAPRDPWAWASFADALMVFGVPSVAKLCAARAIDLLKGSKVDDLGSDMTKVIAGAARRLDTADASPATLEALRAAAATEPDDAEPIVDIARRVVPELIAVCVKELPPIPSPEELADLARRLRPAADEIEREVARAAADREIAVNASGGAA